MSADDFRAWMIHMKLNKAATSRTLGLSRTTIDNYLERGAPSHIGLACAALAFGLPAWKTATQN